ncbi:class I SAM-dependent methyltransferase [Oceanobacillus halotolerans]|uniref:class I SAM-dependent methyltransferase n=1 Tax=Oceanobacillus halotolerans TaxID=2663380 RepID=UPI0013DD2491|nr:class I SAM-dependent methyltransferase [Oceanobacillus halotolerans]
MSKELWNNRFSEEGYVYGTQANPFIIEKSDIIPKASEIGCFAEGEGRNAVHLAKLSHHVTTYDQSKVGLQKTKQLATHHNVDVNTIEMDLTAEKAPIKQYDAAVLVFGHVPKQSQHFFIENIIQSVKPGGYVILEVYSEEQITYQTGGPPTVDNLYSPIDILSWIKPYQCLHFYYGEAERSEGTRHTGVGHVIQAVIKR